MCVAPLVSNGLGTLPLLQIRRRRRGRGSGRMHLQNPHRTRRRSRLSCHRLRRLLLALHTQQAVWASATVAPSAAWGTTGHRRRRRPRVARPAAGMQGRAGGTAAAAGPPPVGGLMPRPALTRESTAGNPRPVRNPWPRHSRRRSCSRSSMTPMGMCWIRSPRGRGRALRGSTRHQVRVCQNPDQHAPPPHPPPPTPPWAGSGPEGRVQLPLWRRRDWQWPSTSGES
jgi:hypothetical protein